MEKIEQKKIILPFIIGSLFLISAAWAFLVWEDTRIPSFDVSSVPLASPAEKYEFALETIESGAMIRIKGWIIERHQETLPVEIDVVLREERTPPGRRRWPWVGRRRPASKIGRASCRERV